MRAGHATNASHEDAAVIDWRRHRLLEAGFAAETADELAESPQTDIHALLDLVDQGCPPALAARILAPLETDRPE